MQSKMTKTPLATALTTCVYYSYRLMCMNLKNTVLFEKMESGLTFRHRA